MATRIITPQDLQFALMRLSSFNNFDGEYVACSLAEHREFWEAFLLDREAYGAVYRIERQHKGREEGELPATPIDLIRLRDLAAGYWTVDALYILPVEGKEKDLELLARRDWSADEIDWVNGQDCPRPVLRVWWD